ncbi:zinc-dependent alcohol dehydrogenase family protein [uncultured Shewanella sp.]|uniref:zinc-dependent alcohol dehydrogenase family protein n=1 Tax=uncultured Shewanella sp. TaxID=173975 RepID=UPI0026099C8B|nr:zinc-dependent alcohol dehydrogenase family protein [uncultured Shewanella sp.]
MKTTQTVRFHQAGDASVLQIDTLDMPKPGVGEVRIKAAAIGLNRAEVMFRNGAYIEQPSYPSKIGYEVSGVIDAVGEGVTDLKCGDIVSTIPAFTMGEYGVYGKHPIVPAFAVAKYPTHLSPAEGTAIWMQYVTAYGALCEVGKLTSDQTILITAASSSVGIAAIQIANWIGATVIATTRGPEKVTSLKQAGAHYVIESDSESISQSVNLITEGQGANLIFDPIGGPLLNELGDAAAQAGIIIEYGALDPNPSIYPLFKALEKALTIVGYTLFELTQDPVRLERAKQFIYQGLEQKKLFPKVDKIFAFEDIQSAHRYMEASEQIGKIVVKI